MNSFKTRSSARKNILTMIFTYVPMFALAFLGLKIAVVTWLFFEGILGLTFCLCLFLVARTHWEIEFKGSSILLYNTGNRQSYCLENLTQSDLILKQSNGQKRKNRCDLKIANTPFGIYDVERCSDMAAYICENIPC